MGFMAAALPYIIPGISSIAGGLLNRNKTDTTGPSGGSLALLNTLQNYYGQAMKNTPEFMQGYETSGLNAIKRGADANAQGMENINAAHGVRGPAAAYASMVPRVAAQSQVAGLQTSLPMVRSQYQNSIMQNALQGVNAGTKSVTQQGQGIGGVFGNLATTLAGLYGMGAYNKKPGTTDPFAQQDSYYNTGVGGND